MISIPLYVLVGCSQSDQIKEVRWDEPSADGDAREENLHGDFFHWDFIFILFIFLNHTVCWWSCMTPHSAAALIEYWQGKLSSVSCSVYIIPPSRHIIDSVEASGAAWCLAHGGDRRDFWSLIVRDTKAREALLEQWGQSSCFFCFFPPRTPPATNTQRCVQQTYKKKKKIGVKGERQQARWHVKLPRWCIA